MPTDPSKEAEYLRAHNALVAKTARAERDAEIRAWCETHNTEGWVDWLDMLDSLGGDTDG